MYQVWATDESGRVKSLGVYEDLNDIEIYCGERLDGSTITIEDRSNESG